jgi:hypothetical protein
MSKRISGRGDIAMGRAGEQLKVRWRDEGLQGNLVDDLWRYGQGRGVVVSYDVVKAPSCW